MGKWGQPQQLCQGWFPNFNGIQYSTQVPTVTRNSVEMTEEKPRQSFPIRHQREDEGATRQRQAVAVRRADRNTE